MSAKVEKPSHHLMALSPLPLESAFTGTDKHFDVPLSLLCWLTDCSMTNTFFKFVKAFGESHPASDVGASSLLQMAILCSFFHRAI